MEDQKSRINSFVGEPQIRSLHITVRDVLSLLAEGKSQEDILKRYPMLEAEDISACLDFLISRRSQLAINFDGSLAYYGIAGVVASWIFFLIICYVLFLFLYADSMTFLQMLFDKIFLWVPFLSACSSGSHLGMRFAPKDVSEDLKRITRRMVSIAMSISTICFFIILIFYNLQ